MSLREEILEKIQKLQAHLDELESIDEDRQAETMFDVFERVSKMPRMPKIGTGVGVVDHNFKGGLSLGSFINIAGENFAGKTTLVLNILKNICTGHKAMFFSFEMYEVLLREKMSDWGSTQLMNLLVEQKRNRLDQIEAIIRTQAKNGVRLFCIDSRMKIAVLGKSEEYQKNSAISMTLSKLCQELGITIILINQMAEQDIRNKRLALKGSGDQAYDSDVILYVLAEVDNGTGAVVGRSLVCTKDRINGNKWKAPLPNFGVPVEIRDYEMELPTL